MERWDDTSNYLPTTMEVSRSFILHNKTIEDTYLKYIQFRTLHRQFYTSDKLIKMGIASSSMCSTCKIKHDSIEQMFFLLSTLSRILEGGSEMVISNRL